MDLNNNFRALILSGLRESGKKKTELSTELGYGKAWVTKLLNGTLKTISDSDAAKIEDMLGIQFVRILENSKVSDLAIQVDEAMEANSNFTDAVTAILRMQENQTTFTPRYFETKEMSRLGNAIIRLCFENEDKPGKVAREVLKLVSSPK